MATYDLTSVSMPDKLVTGDILNCPYSGRKISITLPPGKYKLECWGAQGGYRSSSTYGGKGGYAVGTLELSNLIDVFLYAGGAGGYSNDTGGDKAGGFNGGGYRYGYPGGGGASDIRLVMDTLYARVIVAGGGGSDGKSSNAGGAAGVSASSGYGSGGTMGNTTYSGSSVSTTATQQSKTGLSSSDTTKTYGGFGFGGAGLYRSSGYGGAGGGGWYGGQGTLPDTSVDDDRGGGGGSSYVYTTSTASQYPSGCLLTANCYLLNASTKAGNTSFTDYSGSTVTGHSGNGAVRITVIEIGEGSKIRKEKIRIQQKGDTSTNWNPDYILLNKEIGVETDTGKMKIGNGLHPWYMLPYVTAEKADGFTTPQMLYVYLDDQYEAPIGNGAEEIYAGTYGILPLEKGGTGANNEHEAISNLGAAPQYHTSLIAGDYGMGSMSYYGHLKATLLQDLSQYYYADENAYAQICRVHNGIVDNFNDYGLTIDGQYYISFKCNALGTPSTLVADTGVSTDETLSAILINYTTDPTVDGNEFKQVLIIPKYKTTYERYAKYDLYGSGGFNATQWVNASKAGAPTEKIDFANKGGGRFYYMGRQPKPQSEIAFVKPEDDTGTYVGEYAGWHVTVSVSSPTVTIKRYSLDKTQVDTKTITMPQAFSLKKVVMDEQGLIFLIAYHSTNYPYCAVFQYQIDGTAIDSSITNTKNVALAESNWNSGSDRYIDNVIAFNHAAYFVTRSGEHETTHHSNDYLCLSKITSAGVVSTGEDWEGWTSTLYTNGTDLYWYKSYDKSNSSGYKEDYYIIKYTNGNMSSKTQLWMDTENSTYEYDITYLKQIDKFLIEEIEEDSSHTWTDYMVMDNTGNKVHLSIGNLYLNYLNVSDNYIIMAVQGSKSGWTTLETGVGIVLYNLTDGKPVFMDLYCNYTLGYVRFDETNNLFYFGTDDNYEFVYTIV